ncbi:transporter substrate-binding domain-containing protein [Streptomyces luteireticuli]|uniref:transporter substrate-binding domain-containing protein n=1 Tax=Streptomyces luteireticuli TaxID=173858 RepID=UPI0035561B6E
MVFSTAPQGARVAGAALAVCLVAWMAGCGDGTPGLWDGKEIRVAVKNDQPGTSFSPHAGEYVGFDYMVARELLETDSTKLFPIAVLSKNRASVLKSGEADIVAATYSITPERMLPEGEGGEGLDFVGPYASTRQGVLVRADDKRIRTESDLDGKVVCVWNGTTSMAALREPAYEKVHLRVEEDAGYCAQDLLRKEVDAMSTDRLILYGFASYNHRLKVVPGIVIGAANEYGLAMRKGRREECRRLQEALKRYVRGNLWRRDLQSNISALPQAEIEEGMPSESEIDALSCRDKPAGGYAAGPPG